MMNTDEKFIVFLRFEKILSGFIHSKEELKVSETFGIIASGNNYRETVEEKNRGKEMEFLNLLFDMKIHLHTSFSGVKSEYIKSNCYKDKKERYVRKLAYEI